MATTRPSEEIKLPITPCFVRELAPCVEMGENSGAGWNTVEKRSGKLETVYGA
jgi:hypothetical protein